MIESVSEIQVRYSETDMMGIVYHANYLPWLEIGRTEMLRKYGLPYTELEAKGYFLPVLEVNLRYKRPAKYDDSIQIHTRMKEEPVIRLKIDYEVTRENELLATGHTTHAFINGEGLPLKPPLFFREAMAKLFR